MLYLAGPYTHPDPRVRLARFEQATIVAAELIRRGRIVFSPLTMTHPIDLVLAGDGATLGSDFWLKFDLAFMQRCDELAILKMSGWEESSGVANEVSYFLNERKPIWVVTPEFELAPFK